MAKQESEDTADPQRHDHALLSVPVSFRPSASTPFRHSSQMLVPDMPGVYLIHDLRGILYVGQTENLYRRFAEHYWRGTNDLLARAVRQTFGEMTFSWLLARDPLRRSRIEAELIAWLRPICNRKNPAPLPTQA